MLVHPRFAADRNAAHFSKQELGLQEGWNRIVSGDGKSIVQTERFVHISPEGGISTSVRPPVPTESIKDAPLTSVPFLSSALWANAKNRANEVAHLNDPEYPPERVSRVMQQIAKFANMSVPLDPAFTKTPVLTALHAMRTALRNSNAQKIRHADAFLAVIHVVRSYLDFELPGVVARESLAVILSTLATCPVFGPTNVTPPRLRGEIIQHLAELTYALLREREKCGLESFYWLSYLAALYAGTVGVLAGHHRELAPGSNVDGVPIDRHWQIIDELVAHEIIPTFDYPAELSISECISHVSLTGLLTSRPPIEVAKLHGLHPHLITLLKKEGSSPGLRRVELAREFQRELADRPEIDVKGTLTKEYSPIPSEIRDTVMRFFLAHALGQCAL